MEDKVLQPDVPPTIKVAANEEAEARAWANLLYSVYTKKKQLLSSKQEQNEV